MSTREEARIVFAPFERYMLKSRDAVAEAIATIEAKQAARAPELRRTMQKRHAKALADLRNHDQKIGESLETVRQVIEHPETPDSEFVKIIEHMTVFVGDDGAALAGLKTAA